MTEYLREIKTRRYSDGGPRDTKNYSRFAYFAVGSGKPTPYGSEYPTAEVSGRHIYARFAPTFENKREFGEPSDIDQTGMTGLSDEYLKHKMDKLAQKRAYDGLTGNFTKEEDDAEHALRLISGYRRPSRGDPRDMLWAMEEIDTNPHLAPTQLFIETEPAKTQIGRMFADPSMKSHAMTLAGMAYRDFANTPIEADESLSAQSSKLVQNAMKKGLPVVANPGNPDAEKTNTITDDEHTIDDPDLEEYRERFERVPESDVQASRANMRSMLREARPKRNTKPVTSKGLSNQFLPGLEEYM